MDQQAGDDGPLRSSSRALRGDNFESWIIVVPPRSFCPTWCVSTCSWASPPTTPITMPWADLPDISPSS